VILESELDQARGVELLLQGKPLSGEDPGPKEMQDLLDRLIDRSLLEQQIGQPSNPQILDPKPEEVAERIKEVRSQIPAAASEEGWKEVLQSYGLEQRDIEQHFISEIRVLRFVDVRFRSLVRVDKAEISTYYQETLIPELRRRGSPVPPLAEVSARIEGILVEQHMDKMLNEWLQTLRTQGHIEKLQPFSATGPANGGRP
jgi:peptidyl-prolyl cis-trans isomerase SurA